MRRRLREEFGRAIQGRAEKAASDAWIAGDERMPDGWGGDGRAGGGECSAGECVGGAGCSEWGRYELSCD